MTLKNKLNWSFAFLFTVILLLIALNTFITVNLGEQTKVILKDNYESLDFAQEMLRAIDERDWIHFEKNLSRQQKNITEQGEQEVTQQLEKDFKYWVQTGDSAQVNIIRSKLHRLLDINQAAIVRKSDNAGSTADRFLRLIALVSTIVLLVTFVFIANIPGLLVRPILQLREGFGEIMRQNYRHRIPKPSNDELGELVQAFNQMAERLTYWETSTLAQVVLEKRRIETIINEMDEAVLGLDSQGAILFINHQAAQLLGLYQTDLVGRSAAGVALHNDLLRSLLQRQNEEDLKIFADGKESYFRKNSIDIHNEGQAIGQVIVLRNITPFKELDLAKTNWIATISHEVKTPISSIKMSAGLLEDERIGALNPEQRNLVTGIWEDSERLLKITAELLSLTQVETGNIQLNIQPAVLSDIIRYAADTLKLQAEQRKVSLEIDVPETLPAVLADKDKAAWVLINVLVNAIRYSPAESKVRISAKVTDKAVFVAVQDNGPGIPEEYIDRIFERYFQAPGAYKSGVGLGLAICREFMIAQGGAITASSAPQSGTTMLLTFRREP